MRTDGTKRARFFLPTLSQAKIEPQKRRLERLLANKYREFCILKLRQISSNDRDVLQLRADAKCRLKKKFITEVETAAQEGRSPQFDPVELLEFVCLFYGSISSYGYGHKSSGVFDYYLSEDQEYDQLPKALTSKIKTVLEQVQKNKNLESNGTEDIGNVSDHPFSPKAK